MDAEHVKVFLLDFIKGCHRQVEVALLDRLF